MSSTTSTSSSHRAWDDASSSASEEPVRLFEAAWRRSQPGRRPDPMGFAPGDDPGVVLALLRAELVLKWDSGEREGAGCYRGRGLSDDALVALVYEEFCLREDGGETPEPSRFYARFPEIAGPLRRVLEIHDLVGSGRATSTASFGLSATSSSPPFPETGQTIGGFHLVEELGRGGFARVFLARERQLADRPVALKVARAGSREPQTLARLQHTHIVPVHSYRIDPATGLHLLCMPYFGRVTLAHVLADPAVKEAMAGAELVAALDRLDAEGATSSSARPAGRMALASRPYARAIAWWGARLAEALQHAHDRGVLHRDIKPSNVLVTADGMPMLLDFNLAHEPLDTSAESPAALGGTVAYMSPEHLEALADGRSDGVDGRSDVFALGVVLFEAMGKRPFGPPPSAKSVPEALLRAAEERRSATPRLADEFPEVPAALQAVVARCLAPDPEDRYASAGELAEDLQAVADDMPLPHAREPIAIRLLAKVRRHRRAMAATAVVLLTLGLAGFLSMTARVAELNARIVGERLRAEVRENYVRGDKAFQDDEFKEAAERYEAAERLAGDSKDLAPLGARAKRAARVARLAAETTANTEAFARNAEVLWPILLGFNADRPVSPLGLDETLKPFFVLDSPDWTARDDLHSLKADRRAALVRDVHELLFIAAIGGAASRDEAAREKALAICDVARSIRGTRASHGQASCPEVASLPEGPWEAIRAFLTSGGNARCRPPLPSLAATAWEAYAWGRVLLLEDRGDPRRAAAWLEQAARRHDSRFWVAFDVAYQADRAGRIDLAIEHYGAAINLRPTDARARTNRAHLFRAKGLWSRALDDLNRALDEDPAMDEARLELGVVHQALGDRAAALAAYEYVGEHSPVESYRRAARLNRAKLDFDSGRASRGLAGLDALLADRPDDATVRLARALIALRTGRFALAESDLDHLLAAAPEDAEALGYRAVARLGLGRADAAAADARRAVELDPSPSRERLLSRALLALGRCEDLRLDDPDELRILPTVGPSLRAGLRRCADRLATGPASADARSTRAVILAVLGDHGEAESEATRAIESSPSSPRARLVRARVRRARGDRKAAMKDVTAGLAAEPDDPRLLGLKATLRIESGDPAGALAELDRAVSRIGGVALIRPRAEARTILGRDALADWNRVIASDPTDPTAYLGRARAFLRLAQWDQALADLERASDLCGDRPEIQASIALAYARCLPARPDHLGRVLDLSGRALRGR